MLLSWHRHYNWHRHYSTDWQAHKFDNLLPCLLYLASSSFAHFSTPSLSGETSLHLAASCGIPYDAFQAVIKFGKSLTTAEQYEEVLSDAVLGGERKIIHHVLTASGRYISSRSDMQQKALLHNAVERNNRTEVERLLSHGVDANAPQALGYTPLHKAIIFGSDISIISLLLHHNANVNAKDVCGNTPLHHAVAPSGSALSIPTIRALFRGGANPHSQGEIGYWVSRPPFFNDPYFQFWSVRATATDCVSAFKDKQRIREYFVALRTFYPEVNVDDEDGDIFWDAREEPDQILGNQGSCYEWYKVYNDVSFQTWRKRRDDSRAGASKAWQGEWTLQPHPEKINRGADQFPTIVIYLGLEHEVEKAQRLKKEINSSTATVPDPTRPWLTEEQASALTRPLHLKCSNGPAWPDSQRLELPNKASNCKMLWRFWGAPSENLDNNTHYTVD